MEISLHQVIHDVKNYVYNRCFGNIGNENPHVAELIERFTLLPLLPDVT